MKILSLLWIPPIFVLFWIFFKIGLIFFGGGYVLIPVLHKELVSNLHLLTERQFIDGTAISQLTPGPVAILATFAGYCISGVMGAIVATVATFLPGTCLMLFLSKSYVKIRNSNLAYKVLNKVIPVIVGLLIATVLQLSRTTVTDVKDVLVVCVSFILLWKYKVNPAILIIASAVLGMLLA